MKKTKGKLGLNRETIRALQAHQVRTIAGGEDTGVSCATCACPWSNGGCPTEGACTTLGFSCLTGRNCGAFTAEPGTSCGC